jgi:hypothetical protein
MGMWLVSIAFRRHNRRFTDSTYSLYQARSWARYAYRHLGIQRPHVV